MNRRFLSLIVCLISFLLLFSFPSICFSEMKTVQGEYCQIYLGDMKNKKELDKFRKFVKTESIRDGLTRLIPLPYDPLGILIPPDCFGQIISNYLEKVVVVSHTEKDRKICDKVKITFDTEVVDKYIESICKNPYMNIPKSWDDDIDEVLTKKSDKINIGLIIETKIPELDEHKKEMLENKDEQQFFDMTKWKKEKYKVVDRRHLTKILEEQKLSSSGITDSETVKLGKILNLDIIVLRVLYEKSQVTKVLKVDTGEVLLFRTYETKTEEGWVYYGETEDGNQYYYDKNSLTNINHKIIKVWNKIKFSKIRKDKIVQLKKDYKQPMDGWDKLDYEINLYEFDCVNNTMTSIKFVIYNDKGKILQNFDFSTPIIEQVLPDTMDDLLLRKVCQK